MTNNYNNSHSTPRSRLGLVNSHGNCHSYNRYEDPLKRGLRTRAMAQRTHTPPKTSTSLNRHVGLA